MSRDSRSERQDAAADALLERDVELVLLADLIHDVNCLMGMAFGALLLNTPAAIVLFLVLPTLWTMLSFGWLENLGRWLDTAQTYRYILESDWDGHTGPILVSLAVWVALPLALGTVRTLRREVS